MNNVLAIHHASLLVADVEKSLQFYCEVLGLEQDKSRPNMAFDGAWLNVGSQQIHLINCPNPDPVDGRPEHGGRDRHTALLCTNFENIQNKLEQKGIVFTKSKSGRKALFCRDPDGNAVEIIQS